jgi:hypothetical protein
MVSAHGSRDRDLVDVSEPIGGVSVSNPAPIQAPEVIDRVRRYSELAQRGLPASYISDTAEFSQTVRASRTTPESGELWREGRNLRYAAIVALGVASLAESAQRSILRGSTADDLVAAARPRAADSTDPGAIALVAWAAAEVTGEPDDDLLARLSRRLTDGHSLPTVDTAWMLTAAVAALQATEGAAPHARDIARVARNRLLEAQGQQGIFPHALPSDSLGFFRAHVGCFADQVYPIQALARLAAYDADTAALTSANRAAERICALQGDAGQWWWHYDARDGSVVERYPVYSVHQHAMAPMALLDLARAGGDDHSDSIVRGLDWLTTHPEVDQELVSEEESQIWRKVGRREPAKAARKIAAVTTSIRAGWHLPGINAVFPPKLIDRECRPYELGWLVYAWRPIEDTIEETPS